MKSLERKKEDKQRSLKTKLHPYCLVDPLFVTRRRHGKGRETMANSTVFVTLKTKNNKLHAIGHVHNKNGTMAENGPSVWKITASIVTEKLQPQDCQNKPKHLSRQQKIQDSKRKTNHLDKKKKSAKDLSKNVGAQKKSEKERNRINSIRFSEDVVDLITQIEDGELTLEEVLAMGILPLHEAVARNMLGSTITLLKLGADTSRETAEGVTPLEIAVFNGYFDAASLLIRHGASIDRILNGIQVF